MSVDNWIDSLGRLESSTMSKVNGSNFSTSSLTSSNLSQCVGLSFSLAKMMESIGIGSMSVDNWICSNNVGGSKFHFLGRLESSSMSKVNGSNFSTSSLASSNLSQGVGLSFSLAKMMESIRIGSMVVDYRSSSIGQSNRDSTDCFYSSLRSVGNQSNIMKTTI